MPNLPKSHDAQCVAPLVEVLNVPAAHTVHTDAADVEENVPTAQLVHDVGFVDVSRYLPGTQAVHETDPVPLYPGLHWHAVTLVLAVAVVLECAIGHAKHRDSPVLLANVPMAHAAHALAALVLNLPRTQLKHRDSCVELANVPAVHAVQMLAAPRLNVFG